MSDNMKMSFKLLQGYRQQERREVLFLLAFQYIDRYKSIFSLYHPGSKAADDSQRNILVDTQREIVRPDECQGRRPKGSFCPQRSHVGGICKASESDQKLALADLPEEMEVFGIQKLASHGTKTSRCTRPTDRIRDGFEFILASGLHQKNPRTRFDASCPAIFVPVSVHIFLVSNQHRWLHRAGIVQIPQTNAGFGKAGKHTVRQIPNWSSTAPSISLLIPQPSSRSPPCWGSLLSYRIARLNNSSATCLCPQGVRL